MKKLIFTLILTGCGEPFSTTLFHAESSPDAGDVVDAPQAAGGAPSSGGASHGTGGSFQETGGSFHGSGGSSQSGGASTGGAPATGGVEATGGAAPTGGSPATGGAPPADAGCTPVTHDNGIGQTWIDCAPLGTYDENQAMKACAAHTGDSRKCAKAPGCGSATWVIQAASDPNNYIWGYEGNTAGYVSEHGGCPNSIDSSWD